MTFCWSILVAFHSFRMNKLWAIKFLHHRPLISIIFILKIAKFPERKFFILQWWDLMKFNFSPSRNIFRSRMCVTCVMENHNNNNRSRNFSFLFIWFLRLSFRYDALRYAFVLLFSRKHNKMLWMSYFSSHWYFHHFIAQSRY